VPIIDKVLQRSEFNSEPPLLIDVGASGGLHPAWKALAKYSVCIAFDADSREMRMAPRASNVYRELHIYDRAATASPEGTADFYLTRAPACSSLLPPRPEKLAAWEFAERFDVMQKTTVKTIRLQTVLDELKIERVDWFKTDSQGTDLRLFQSLGEPRMRRVLVAEFEPGILDSYAGEDKLWQLMALMDSLNFWMADIEIKGSQRIRKSVLDKFQRFEREYLIHVLKPAPGWAEVTYLNTFSEEDYRLREYLLFWVCATIRRQHGFALELVAMAKARFSDPILEDLENHSIRAVRMCYGNLVAYLPLISRLFHRWRKQQRHKNRTTAVPTKLPTADHGVVGGNAHE